MKLRISLFVIAALLLAAHYLRSASFIMTALCAAAPLFFLARKRWSLIVLQLMAYAATANWILVGVRLVELRQQMGERWTAAAVILGTAALFTLLIGLLLNSRAIKQHYTA